MQTYSSRATSINSARLPAVYRNVPRFRGRIVLDYGCGRYTDHIREALPEHIVYLPYDPYNQPEDVNQESMALVRLACRTGTAVTVVCSNVLNVIDDVETIRNIANTVRYIVAETGGIAFITVYEGDRTGTGRRTGPDQYQRNEPLREYSKYFPGSIIRDGSIVVS